MDPSKFLRIGNKFVFLQRYKDCFFTILIKHLNKIMLLKNKVKMLI